MTQLSQAVPNTTVELSDNSLLSRLKNTDIFCSMKEEDLRCLTGLEERTIHKGEVLCSQGEMSHHFWILFNGTLDVIKTMADGSAVPVSIVQPGFAFGEMPLLANLPNSATLVAREECQLIQIGEEAFWNLMHSCVTARRAILNNMAQRLQKMQSMTVQQEKMASLGTLAAGLMHELNNPGAAARRAASQLRSNLTRMHELTARFSKSEMSHAQKECMFDLQEHALSMKQPMVMSSLEQTDAEEALAEWMEEANIENAWMMAPALVSVGINADDLRCARAAFAGSTLSDALNWLEALVSSMQLVGTIEESISRVTDLVVAVKTYAYEGKGKLQTIDVNKSLHATLLILNHKMREKEIVVTKDFAADLPDLQSDCSGLNQIWTNLLDNAIDAVGQHGQIEVKTWAEPSTSAPQKTDILIRIADNGTGIPPEVQSHIFETFFTTKPLGVGTGLGLGIVHRIVEQYGGQVHFHSVPGRTEFTVRIPATR